MFVILFNFISLGIEVDIAAWDGPDKVPIWFAYMNMLVVFIVCELTVNFIANGPYGRMAFAAAATHGVLSLSLAAMSFDLTAAFVGLKNIGLVQT